MKSGSAAISGHFQKTECIFDFANTAKPAVQFRTGSCWRLFARWHHHNSTRARKSAHQK